MIHYCRPTVGRRCLSTSHHGRRCRLMGCTRQTFVLVIKRRPESHLHNSQLCVSKKVIVHVCLDGRFRLHGIIADGRSLAWTVQENVQEKTYRSSSSEADVIAA